MIRTPSSVGPAGLRLSEDGPAFSERFGDVYCSTDGGLAETRHVFLAGNGIPARWRDVHRFTITETGFGTGLNFLATWQEWRACAPARARLHYVSVEKYPLSRDELARACARWPELAAYAQALIRVYPPPVPGFHRMHFDGGCVSLTLLLGEAATMLSQLDSVADAIFLDGFVPAKNQDIWSAAVFRELARMAVADTTLATYTVCGEVRRGLAEAGFRVEKRAGFGRKREMLVGVFDGRRARVPARAPSRCHAAVIGAGLAGTACAERLAARGWTVDLIERHPEPAREASGNPAGILHPALLSDRRSRSAFTTAATLYMNRELEVLDRGAPTPVWKPSGVLQVCRDPRRLQRLERAAADIGLPECVARRVDREEGSALAGARIGGNGFWFEHGCWAAAASICEARIAAGGARVRRVFQREALRLSRTENGWRALDRDGQVLSDTPVMVLANAADAMRFCLAADLPLRSVRGQVTRIPAGAASALRAPLCGDGYVTPALDGSYCVGATFDEDDPDPAVRGEAHSSNLARLRRMLPDFALPDNPATLSGWVGFRAVSPDRLPLVGPLAGESTAGLFACLALGARGLTVSGLAAELLASMVTGDPLPVERHIAHQLAPGRFAGAELRS